MLRLNEAHGGKDRGTIKRLLLLLLGSYQGQRRQDDDEEEEEEREKQLVSGFLSDHCSQLTQKSSNQIGHNACSDRILLYMCASVYM